MSRQAPATEVVIHSRALFSGSLRVSEKRGAAARRRLSGSYFKERTVPVLFWLLRKAPRPVALWPAAVLLQVARAIYWLPSNPLRRAAQHMAMLCRDAGYVLDARSVYRDYLANLGAMTALVLRLYRDGWQAVVDDVVLAKSDVERLDRLMATHGGLVIAVPHNMGSAFSGVKLCKAFTTVLLAKNSASIRRTRIAVDFFERLDATVLMVRQGNPMQISRSMIKLLRTGHALAATVDLLTDARHGIATRIFGQEVYFPAWATRVPTAIGVPIVPAYVHSEAGRLRVHLGAAVVTKDPVAATHHVASYLEERILGDPASWAFLAEKKWGKVLEAAVAARASGDEQR